MPSLVAVRHTFLRQLHENFQQGQVQRAARLDVACDVSAPFGVRAAASQLICLRDVTGMSGRRSSVLTSVQQTIKVNQFVLFDSTLPL